MTMTLKAATTTFVRTKEDETRHRDRLDASILHAFAERRVLRSIRTSEPSPYWDRLEHVVQNAATLLWELSSASVHMDVSDDLLAFCAFLARELEVTEGLDLTAEAECIRLTELAPRALAALNEIASGLEMHSSGTPTGFFTRALFDILRSFREELTFASMPCALKAA